jgi:hypothetical protein
MEDQTKHEMHQNPHLKEAREHFREVRRTMYKSWEKLLPEGFMEQHRKTRKEMLLGFRSILDYAIEKSEKHTKEM